MRHGTARARQGHGRGHGSDTGAGTAATRARARQRHGHRRAIAEDVSAYTQLVDVPALVIAGERDQLEPVETLRNNLMPYLSGAELRVIAVAGHLIPLEAPERPADTIAQFRPVH